MINFHVPPTSPLGQAKHVSHAREQTTARIPTLPTHHTMRALHSHGWKSAQLWFWFGIYDGCDIVYDYYC
jgi:hypothetical protein